MTKYNIKKVFKKWIALIVWLRDTRTFFSFCVSCLQKSKFMFAVLRMQSSTHALPEGRESGKTKATVPPGGFCSVHRPVDFAMRA